MRNHPHHLQQHQPYHGGGGAVFGAAVRHSAPSYPSAASSSSSSSSSSSFSSRGVEASKLTTNTASTIRVLAPATLEEGYQFDVMLTDRNRPYTVTVPRGGVKEGEEFEIPIPAALGTHPTSSEGDEDDEDKNGKDVDEEAGLDRIEEEDYAKEKFGASSPSDRGGGDDDERTKPPTGRWRRGLCGCCGVLTQATFWMGCICTPILMGQLLTRLNLDWRGRPTDDPVVRAMTFNRIVMSAITVLLLGYIPVVGLVIILLYWIGVVVVIGSNVRTYIRRRYRIRTTCCPRICDGRFNDCLCMLTCGSCATIQMARQTHNDLEYPGYCCTTTGLTPDAPRLV